MNLVGLLEPSRHLEPSKVPSFRLVWISLLGLSGMLTHRISLSAEYPFAAPEITSLTRPDLKFRKTDQHYVVLKRGPVTAIIADNHAVDAPELPGHRARYNGLASLRHADHPENIFVPKYAGLNFEHIHDGTARVNQQLFEPREVPMELRLIDDWTVELYQPPTPMWKLESCGRYHLLPDGTIEYTFECISHQPLFFRNQIGLFWASYIQSPEDPGINFFGKQAAEKGPEKWIHSISPKHGLAGTHPPAGEHPEIILDPGSNLVLARGFSTYVHTSDWYYGVSHGLACVQMFRSRDKIWIVQSPDGGGRDGKGQNCPAWDFQWFIPESKVGRAYGLVMRFACLPFTSREQLVGQIAPHLEALSK